MEVRGNAKLFERRLHLYLNRIDQLYVKNSADLQHCILLRDKLVTNVVIRVTEGFNLQCNKVARQVEEKCCSYYRTFNLLSYFFVKKIPLSRPVGYVMDGSMGE